MTLTDLVAPNAILPALKANNKKQAIQELAARAAELTGQNERAIQEILLQREKLGSTAVGNGVAIPHGKLPKLGRLFGLFARLERRSTSTRSTASRSIWCFCCWRRKPPAPIISRRWRASRVCCATRKSPASCASSATPTRFLPSGHAAGEQRGVGLLVPAKAGSHAVFMTGLLTSVPHGTRFS